MASYRNSYITDGLIMWLDGLTPGEDGNWKDLMQGIIFTLVGNVEKMSDGFKLSGGHFTSADSRIVASLQSHTIEIVFTPANTNNWILFMPRGSSELAPGNYQNNGLIYATGENRQLYGFTPIANKRSVLSVNASTASFNNTQLSFNGRNNYWSGQNGTAYIGRRASGEIFNGTIHCVRIYNRLLTFYEMQTNQAVDNIRYNLGL